MDKKETTVMMDAYVDYSPFQLEAYKKMRDAHAHLVDQQFKMALDCLDEAMANLKLMRTAVKQHA
jgi:hypothetical protein